MKAGETVVLRETEEHVVVLAVVDAAGSLLVQPREGAPFQVAPDDVEPLWARHAGCACCR